MNSNPTPDNVHEGQYKVVALKYRPQSFADLVGQSHIATALSNAIDKNRVGHAYLFTGARGVGKTSSARIFAKCLNCEQGPTKTPCGECDICQAVSAGEDVDVLEIDGASNRGIDEIRQLRSNAAVRPSRSKYKIYIIDEVHMLTMQAFNALLKTLEEPPGHVKFIFCTTDPQKIPITVLSRCQRFDFSPVQTDEIAKRLREIAENEGVTADEQALALLARRANGSMRDSQSLLEQLFSFCGTDISVDEVHQLLGTADMSRISAIATAMANRDPTETLNLIHRGMIEGVDAGQMADQLLGYFRDMMAVRVGCGEDTLLNCTAPDMKHLSTLADKLGLETILTIVQMLDSAVVRMQSSLHSRTLLEAAAVRICNLEKLDAISDLVNSLAKPGAKPVAKSNATPRRPRVQMQQVEYKKAEASQPSKKNDLANESAIENVLSVGSASEVGSASAVGSASEVGSASHVSSASAVSSATAVGAATADGDGASVSAQPLSGTAVDDPNVEDDPIVATPQSEVLAEPKVEQPPSQTVSTSVPNVSEPASETVTRENATTVPESVPPRENRKSILTAANVETFWKQLLDEMGDMTADMASDYESLKLKQPGHLVVTLPDTVSTDLCSKPDRKQKFESALERITGAKMRVDFLASKRTKEQHAPAPKLSRVQQIRKLQEVSFVKQTISLFDAEITGYQEPARTKKR